MKKINPDKPLTDKEWESLGPAMHGIKGLPKEAQQAIKNSLRGRPYKETPKKSISIRLDASIIDEFRSHGKGWQTEINNILGKALEERP